MFEIYKTKEQLKSLSERADIDTVCAFDYQKMKTFAIQGHGLQYKDYNPAIQGITVPQLWKPTSTQRIDPQTSKQQPSTQPKKQVSEFI